MQRLISGFSRFWVVASALWLALIVLTVATAGNYRGGTASWFFERGWTWIILPPFGLWLAIRATLWIIAGFLRQR